MVSGWCRDGVGMASGWRREEGLDGVARRVWMVSQGGSGWCREFNEKIGSSDLKKKIKKLYQGLVEIGPNSKILMKLKSLFCIWVVCRDTSWS